jgi:pimeloyl-ACP methyl ester carboxylesterase
MAGRTRARAWVAVALLVGGLTVPIGVTGAAADEPDDVVDVPVSFTVRNVNESKVPCPADGREYTVRGNLVAPRAVLDGDAPRALTLYLHGLSHTGDSFFHQQDVPGYDYVAEQAEAGHASLSFDLPGYGESEPLPDGRQLCYGSEATIIHQMIGQLRSGDYAVDKGEPATFDRFALAGHSAAGFTAQAMAYSFDDLDALIVLAFADQGLTPATLAESVRTNAVCLPGGEPQVGEPDTTGYAYFGQSEEEFRDLQFHNAEPEVVAAATAVRPKDPCGRVGSAPQNIVTDTALLATVDIPVLLVYGEDDEIFDSGPLGTPLQKSRYTGSDDVADVFLPDTGHALTLERTAPQMRGIVSDWLGERGF